MQSPIQQTYLSAEEKTRDMPKIYNAGISSLPEEKLCKLLVALAEDAIYVKDLKSRYILVNKKALKMFGNLACEELLGKNDYKILSQDAAKGNIKDDQIVFKTARPSETTKRISIKGKEYFFQTRKTPIKNNNGKTIGLVGIARDVTGYRIREKEFEDSRVEFQASKDELIRSEKLAFTGRVAASIAHEIRNPLTNITMSIQQIKKALKSTAPQIEDVAIIERNINRVNYLITELLNCARPPKLKLSSCNVHKLLRDALESDMNRIKSQKIKIVKKFFTTKPYKIEIDKEQVERALLNVVTNAVDAMPHGGTLTITTDKEGDSFIVKIEDTGRGIPEKNIMQIFDLFFSTKSGGIGLGLTVCYGIIVSHGGTIEVESKIRKGSSFKIFLPIKQKLREREREREREA